MTGVPILYFFDHTSTTSDYIFASIICLFLFTNAFSVGPVKWVYMSEVFPISVRSHAIQIILFAEGATGILASYSLYMISHLGLSLSFFILSIAGYIMAILVKVYAEETSNKTFNEIDNAFRTSNAKSQLPCFQK